MPELPDSVHRCRLLVDGYNLMFGQGWDALVNRNHPGLQRGRETLALNLAERIPAELRPMVWIGFDALDAPAHLPSSTRLRDMQVFFSRQWASADEMLQQILVAHPSPRSVVVLSSDHAVQRKASARGAVWFDQDHWQEAIDAAFESATTKEPLVDPIEGVRDRFVSDEERNDWMKRFGF
ncbi:MAG: NYN domain-containing protein [Planctomycetota bacterium]